MSALRVIWCIRRYQNVANTVNICQKVSPTVSFVRIITRHKSSDETPSPPVGQTKSLKLTKPGKSAVQADDSGSSSSDESSSSEESSSDSDEEVDAKLVSAVDAVAESIGGDKKRTKSELLSKLNEHAKLVEEQKGGLPTEPQSLSSLVSGMKVKSSRVRPKLRDEPKDRKRPRDGLQHKKKSMDDVFDNFKLFQEPALGIFSPPKPDATAEIPKSYSAKFDEIEQEELEQSMTFPPVNAFEEMIRWTEEGKMWHYPINNEQGLDEEAKVGFHEHVFFGAVLKDFPQKGPVRHFMELVTTGLSANPYLTVAQKYEHIEWYKEYFKDKYQRIDELTVVADQTKSKVIS